MVKQAFRSLAIGQPSGRDLAIAIIKVTLTLVLSLASVSFIENLLGRTLDGTTLLFVFGILTTIYGIYLEEVRV